MITDFVTHRFIKVWNIEEILSDVCVHEVKGVKWGMLSDFFLNKLFFFGKELYVLYEA